MNFPRELLILCLALKLLFQNLLLWQYLQRQTIAIVFEFYLLFLIRFQKDYRYAPQLTTESKKYLKKLRSKYGNEKLLFRYQDTDFLQWFEVKRKIYLVDKNDQLYQYIQFNSNNRVIG